MPLDKKLLEILCDPVTKVPVTMLSSERLQRLNRSVANGEVRYVNGDCVDQPLDAALVTEDGKVIYRVDDDIPVMLEDQGIGTTQFKEF